jgi:hypothetical protein
MTSTPLCGIHALARRLGLPAGWLKAEANAGRIPCLRVGRQLRFNPVAVEAVLSDQAGGGRVHEEGVSDAR